MHGDFHTSPIDPSEGSKVQKESEALAKEASIVQESSSLAITQAAEEAFNPVMMTRRFESLEDKVRKKDPDKETTKADEKILAIEDIESIASEFEKRNPELLARTLQLLLSQIKGDETVEEILEKVMRLYPDHSLADEALEFLGKTLQGDLKARVLLAKASLNATFGREITAGKNMGTQARAFSKEGLGTPTGLRDIYRDITGNPRPATQLFEQLTNQFTYEKMKMAIDFLLHALGSDLKSKGPSIAPGQLHTLMSEARNLLAILGIYRFFQGRMDLIKGSFERSGMLLPPRITFEILAKMFIQILLERYPSMEKVLGLSLKMGISSSTLAQIILFTQMRDAVRGVAPRFFRTDQHRHDVLMSFIEALEDLEEEFEGEEEEEPSQDQENEEE